MRLFSIYSGRWTMKNRPLLPVCQEEMAVYWWPRPCVVPVSSLCLAGSWRFPAGWVGVRHPVLTCFRIPPVPAVYPEPGILRTRLEIVELFPYF